GRAKAKKDIESYSEAIRQDKANPSNYFHRGRMHQYLKNYDQAISDFSDAIRLSPQSSQFYLARAAIYMLLDKPILSRADVTNARSVDP
ncbi:tetratricopeptide repeat protein, partial [Enterococcus faecium]